LFTFLPAPRFAKLNRGTAHGLGAAVEDLGVDHGGVDFRVTEEYLDGPDIAAILKQMGDGIC
jgi:hypothetical protein